jgi:hypothetical protein
MWYARPHGACRRARIAAVSGSIAELVAVPRIDWRIPMKFLILILILILVWGSVCILNCPECILTR